MILTANKHVLVSQYSYGSMFRASVAATLTTNGLNYFLVTNNRPGNGYSTGPIGDPYLLRYVVLGNNPTR